MGTVGNMQSLKPLVLLILGLCFVKGDYWWMGQGDAFGGNSETQVKRASCGGYGGGCGSKKTQTSLPPYTDTSSSSVSKTQQLTVIQPNPIPVQQQVQVNQPNPIPVQQTVQAAASQPFITCPSAMKCVQKITCNFNGVMVEEQVQLTALQETQRVPLIPCFNPSRSNAVDVCCRDPNYKDPWPASQNGQQQQFDNGQYNGQQQQQFNSGNQNIKQQHLNDNLRQEEQGSGLFQDSSSTFVRTAVPKKRKTHGYGK